jgi:hypothetical protein
MDSTSELIDEAKGTKDKGLAKVKISRGMSAWACAAKARNWTLESSKDPSTTMLRLRRHVIPNPSPGPRTLKGGGFGLTRW